jgi:hypothetical protein
MWSISLKKTVLLTQIEFLQVSPTFASDGHQMDTEQAPHFRHASDSSCRGLATAEKTG